MRSRLQPALVVPELPQAQDQAGSALAKFLSACSLDWHGARRRLSQNRRWALSFLRMMATCRHEVPDSSGRRCALCKKCLHVTPTASPTPAPPLDKQLEEALTISGTTARDSALFIVAQDAVINMDYWTAIRAADATSNSTPEAQSLSFLARCAIEDGKYDMAAEAAAKVANTTPRNQMQLEVIAARKSAPSAQASYSDDRQNMDCFNLPSQ